MPENTFKTLAAKYTKDDDLVTRLWNEIQKKYSGRKRYYHNEGHLANLLAELKPVQSQIEDWDCVLFALFYHDIIYNVLKSDNEEQSAELAANRMQQINVDDGKIQRCRQHILATKSHKKSGDADTNYFTDADLSILGQSPKIYTAYTEAVRKEFSVYPDFLYKPGRKKALQHFLNMDRIFKTGYFHTKLEQQARENIARELKFLK